MFKYANREVLKYLALLMTTVLAGALFLGLTAYFFEKKHEDFEKRVVTFDLDILTLQKIKSNIISIKADILEMTAATQNSAQREKLRQAIEKNIEETLAIKRAIHQHNHTNPAPYVDPLHNTMTKISPLLKDLTSDIDEQMQLLNRRDAILGNGDTSLLQRVARQIRSLNAQLPAKVDRTLVARVDKAQKILQNAKAGFVEELEKKRKYYLGAEFVLLTLGVLVTLWILRVIALKAVTLYKSLENQLYIDALTGLYSRTALQKGVEQNQRLALIIIDIVAFKNINDLYGAQVGNITLQKLAKYLQGFQSKKEFSAYRIASDEFVLLYEDATIDEEFLAEELSRLLEYLNEHLFLINQSVGYIQLEYNLAGATCKECSDNPMGRVDMALNYAKENNLSFAIYDKKIDKKVELRQNIFWKKSIKEGLEKDAFVPFFQKIVDKDGQVVKYEALMRLKQTREEETLYISPFKYLDVAKKTKFYLKISSMIITKSLATCKDLGVDISINISAQDMQSKKIVSLLKETIIKNDIAKHVVLEIVESESVSKNQQIKEFVEEFRDLGVRFAIDDFGSGFSNFSYILEIKPEFLKIDGSLIKDITENPHSYELVKSIVAFAKALDVTTVAEFVHSKEVFETVLALGVDEFQGYYFHEPSQEISSKQ